MRRIGALAALLAGTAACAGERLTNPPAEVAKPVREPRLVQPSFEQQRPDRAAALYRRALEHALRRDDLIAVAELGSALALAHLRRDRAALALTVARSTRAEIAHRGSPPPAELLLVEAAALYRTGDGDRAETLATAVLEAPDASADAQARALFLRGLVAAERADPSALAAALAALPASDRADLRADRAELQGRLELLQDAAEAARLSLLSAADARREALDYRGEARALALAGEAAGAGGRSAEAAELYLRAGRTAQLSGSAASARRWLATARDLALRTGNGMAAAEAARRLQVLDSDAEVSVIAF